MPAACSWVTQRDMWRSSPQRRPRKRVSRSMAARSSPVRPSPPGRATGGRLGVPSQLVLRPEFFLLKPWTNVGKGGQRARGVKVWVVRPAAGRAELGQALLAGAVGVVGPGLACVEDLEVQHPDREPELAGHPFDVLGPQAWW